ncbi:hypothetical protein ASG54_03345 [Aureimonas sp. Leaf460]|nr:hypothetical protein ASG62_21380 [Aureimonas sp. Leaf427]KQT78068.1 hypothetical protein ASG54_03345 [Aureimonas sp. Leaf460]
MDSYQDNDLVHHMLVDQFDADALVLGRLADMRGCLYCTIQIAQAKGELLSVSFDGMLLSGNGENHIARGGDNSKIFELIDRQRPQIQRRKLII